MKKYWKVNDVFVDPYESFIYEVDLHVMEEKSWRLEDIKRYSCKEFIENIIDYSIFIYKDYKLVKTTTLLAAPLQWLEQNATLVEYETPKEKRKRKLLEKQK